MRKTKTNKKFAAFCNRMQNIWIPALLITAAIVACGEYCNYSPVMQPGITAQEQSAIDAHVQSYYGF